MGIWDIGRGPGIARHNVPPFCQAFRREAGMREWRRCDQPDATLDLHPLRGAVQGVRQWGGISIENSKIIARELLLAIPQGATQAQLAALQQLQQWASTVGVTINVTVIP